MPEGSSSAAPVIRPGPSSAKNAATGCRFTTSGCGIRNRYWFRFTYFGFEVEDELGELLLSEEEAGLLPDEDESEPDFLSSEPDFASEAPSDLTEPFGLLSLFRA